ncbi:MAG: sigma-70 family RNA polymerase sigma factor [Planctomycetaceae bacterium]
MTDLAPPESSHVDVGELIAQSRMGNREFLGTLFEYYEAYLLKIANSKLDRDISVKTAPSDLVQNTLKQAHKHYDQFRGTTENEFQGWLITILENEFEDTKRKFIYAWKRSIHKEISLPGNEACGNKTGLLLEDSLTPSQPLVDQETMNLFQEAMNRMPDSYQQVIQLRSIENRSFKEVATIIKKEIAATQKLWARAVDRFKHELLQNDPHYHERLR